jgi:hypothetical protein
MSKAADLARDAVDLAREADNLASEISIPARDAADQAKDFPEWSLSFFTPSGREGKKRISSRPLFLLQEN